MIVAVSSRHVMWDFLKLLSYPITIYLIKYETRMVSYDLIFVSPSLRRDSTKVSNYYNHLDNSIFLWASVPKSCFLIGKQLYASCRGKNNFKYFINYTYE